MEKIIKEYLEKTCTTDDALKEKYNAEMVTECCNYITNLAKEKAEDNYAFIEDNIVFKWARDYFVDNIAEKMAQKKAEDERKAAEEREAEKEKYEKEHAEEIAKQKKLEEEKHAQVSMFDLMGA